MFIGYAVLAAVLALALFASAFLTFTRNPQIMATMTRLEVPESWLPWLATAKTAGAIGLLVGLVIPFIGVAAAVGVALYFLGAVITHLRGKDYAVAPLVILTVLPIVALVLRVASA
ncbi:DoxX family protein [Streptomyces sp. NPDC056144]|uniref:DoxX family protein n=1 Tax=unclassified Streptomyces TaxID=2593676 RepID=UPI0035DA0C01